MTRSWAKQLPFPCSCPILKNSDPVTTIRAGVPRPTIKFRHFLAAEIAGWIIAVILWKWG